MYRGWHRNISPMKQILARAEALTPSMRCTARSPAEFAEWKQALKARLDELLAPFPQRVPVNARTIARIEREHDWLEKFVIDVESDLCAPGYLMIPKDLKAGERRPALLACHGHDTGGPGGKEMIAGTDRRYAPDDAYGERMAREGYVVAVLDNRGFGERTIPIPPGGAESRCNLLYLLYAMLGEKLITLNIHDQLQTLDYLLTRPEVEAERVGVFGKSMGGTLSQYVGVYDERVKAVCICCYLCETLEYTFEDVNNNCGSQFVPGLFPVADVATVAGLVAPRPLLVQSGIADGCFAIDSAVNAHAELRSIYSAAGCEDKLTLDVVNGGHEFNLETAREFFDRWLGPVR